MKYIADSSEPMPTSNLDRLITAARLLRPLLDELVFVGGSVAGLLITDEAAGELRPTLDVDAIAEITSYGELVTFGDRLRALDFAEDTSEEAPLCRWVNHGTILDVMPLDEAILGFSNRWYFEAMQAATTRQVAAREIAGFLDDSKFLDAVPGHLLPDGVSQLRLGIVIERLKKLASY